MPALTDIKLFLEHYLKNYTVGVTTYDERRHPVNSFAAVQIPDWAVKQKLDALARAITEELELLSSVRELIVALETCHVCQGSLSLDDVEPTHCENCSSDCEAHEGEQCTALYILHRRVSRALKAIESLDETERTSTDDTRKENSR